MKTLKGLERMRARLRRGMVWKWNAARGTSHEVSAESARRRRLARGEKK